MEGNQTSNPDGISSFFPSSSSLPPYLSAPNFPDTSIFRSISQKALLDQLDRIPGAKTIILDPSLAGPLGLITELPLLKSHGVDRLFWLERTAEGKVPPWNPQWQRNVIYLSRTEKRMMQILAELVRSAPSQKHTHTLLLAPQITSICTTTLEEEGVYGSIDVQEFPLGLIPLEKDLLSLEMEEAYKQIFFGGDYGPVFDMAKCLITFQQAFGTIPRIIGQGVAARRLASLLVRLAEETPPEDGSGSALGGGSIDSMIVLDRSVDMVTPMCTQLTYEGLVDEVIGIKNSHVEVDPNLLTPPAASTSSPMPSSSTTSRNFSSTSINQPPRPKKHHLSSTTDPLFAELRDQNFAVVGNILNKTAKRLNEDYERRHQAQTVAQIREFVGQLGGLQSEHTALRLHTGLTEKIMATTVSDEFNRALEIQQNLVAGLDLPGQENAIRDLINQEIPVRNALRLVCLYSLVSGGIKPKVMEDLKREILQTYGLDHIPLLLSLQSLSLLTRPPATRSTYTSSSSSSSAITNLRKPLKLIVDEIDELSPEDVSYVFSGYAPLSVRLVQGALGVEGNLGNLGSGNGSGNGVASTGAAAGGGRIPGWKGMEDVMKFLPGQTFEQRQKVDEQFKARELRGLNPVTTTVVCFLGGVTYAEVSALRFLSQKTGRNLIIVTTGLCQGNSIITSLMSPPTRQSAYSLTP